jgi:outer membrane cobalamin receptor
MLLQKTALLLLSVAALVLFPVFLSDAFAQDVRYPPAPPAPKPAQHPSAQDSAAAGRIDTTRRAPVRVDSLALPDSLGRPRTLPLFGSLDPRADSALVRTSEDIHWIDRRSVGDILKTIPGVFMRTQSSVGQYDQIAIHGADWRSVAILSNGRLLNDPASGVYNLYAMSQEYTERIEVVTGPRAFLYGLNSAGGAVNQVTLDYNTNRAVTQIAYEESAFGYSYTDGLFTQNVSRKMNFLLGFQHQLTDGRFANSNHDDWNMRARVRYGLSGNLDILLSEYLTSTETHLNGGVDLASSGSVLAFSAQEATVNNRDAYEKITRHDVDLSLIGTFLGDTSDVSRLTFYYSHALREFRDDENTPESNGFLVHADHRSSWMGALFSQNVETKFQRFSVGANIETRRIENSPNLGMVRNTLAAVWAKEELVLDSRFTVAFYGRYDRFLGDDHLGLGADATFGLGGGAHLFLGGSISRRFPNYVEEYWTDSSVTRSVPLRSEEHLYLEVGAEVQIPSSGTIRVAGFHRAVKNPIVPLPYTSAYVFPGIDFINGGTRYSNGLEASFSARLWYILLEGTGTYLIQKDAGGSVLTEQPKLIADGGVYYQDRLLNDKLELKVGIRAKYLSSSSGELFNPEVLSYVENTGTRIGWGSSADFLLIAHIGDAYFHFVWENLTDVRYFTTPYYPAGQRAIRFGIVWGFLN